MTTTSSRYTYYIAALQLNISNHPYPIGGEHVSVRMVTLRAQEADHLYIRCQLSVTARSAQLAAAAAPVAAAAAAATAAAPPSAPRARHAAQPNPEREQRELGEREEDEEEPIRKAELGREDT